MKLLIVAMPNSAFVVEKISEAFVAKGHEVDVRYYSQMNLEFGSEVSIKFAGEKLGHYDAAVLRMAEGKSMIWYKEVLTRFLIKKGTKVVNGSSFLKYPYLGKVVQNYLLLESNLPVVRSTMYMNVEDVANAKMDFPVMIKPNFGRLGEGIVKASDLKDLEKALLPDPSAFMVQDFLDTGEDYRVLVIGHKAMPVVMKKKAQEGSHVTNFSQGGIVSAEEITPELADLSERASVVFDSDYCGVDIMYDMDDNPHILEINRSANFRGYEQATGESVPQRLLEYIESII